MRKYRLILSDDLGNKHSSLTALTPQSLYYSFRKLTAKLDWLIPAAVGVKHSYFSVLRHLFRHGRGIVGKKRDPGILDPELFFGPN